MVNLIFHSSFERAYKRKAKPGTPRHKKLQRKVALFTENPFNKSLKTHKLEGQLKDYWSFAIEYDLRVVFYFEDPNTAVFIDIGSHDEVY